MLADVEEPADVRMAETGDEPRFAGQALLCVCVARMGVRQHLDGDRPLEARVDGFVYFAHAARADQGEESRRDRAGRRAATS